jgi:hypothetical protein
MRIAIALAVLGAGCTLIDPYPTSIPEICDNGVDDDLDGLADCFDRSCDGHCREEDRSTCTNGRDDDGDGRTDLADARCWPYGIVHVARCPTIFGMDGTYDTLDSLTSYDSSIVVQPDPDDATRTVLGLAPGGGLGDVAIRHLGGAWDGTSVTLRVYIADGATFTINVGPYELFVQRVGVDANMEDGAFQHPFAAHVAAGWWQIEIDFAADVRAMAMVVTAHVTTPDATTLELPVVSPHAWPPAGALDVTMSLAASATGSVLFDAMHVHRGTGRTCAASFGPFLGVVMSAAGTPIDGCVTGFDAGGSAIDFRTTAEVASAGASLTLPSSMTLAPAIAATPHGFAGIGYDTPHHVALLMSVDCTTWTSLGNPFAMEPTLDDPDPMDGPLTNVPAYSLGYIVRPDDPASHGAHDLTIATHQLGVRGVLRARSPDGSPGSFVVTRFRSLEDYLGIASDFEGWRSRVTVTGLGDDDVFLIARDEWSAPGDISYRLHVYVDHSTRMASGLVDSLLELRDAEIGESGVERAADGFGGIMQGILVENGPLTNGFAGMVIYRNRGSVPVADVASITIQPPEVCTLPVDETCANRIDDDCDGWLDESPCTVH